MEGRRAVEGLEGRGRGSGRGREDKYTRKALRGRSGMRDMRENTYTDRAMDRRWVCERAGGSVSMRWFDGHIILICRSIYYSRFSVYTCTHI